MATKKTGTKKRSPVRKVNPTDSVVTQTAEVFPVVETISISPPVTVEQVVETPAPAQPVPDNPIYRYPGRLLGLVLLLGWSFDFLFWKQDVGVNFPIFITLCLLGGLVWLLSHGTRPARSSLLLLLPLLFFAAVAFLRQEPLTTFLAFVFTLIAAGLFASSYAGGRWPLYGLTDYFYKSLLLLGDALTGLAVYAPKAQKIQRSLESHKKTFPIWALLRGLLIAFPIVACFGALLAAGDVVFEQKLDNFLDLDDLSENILRGALILVYAYILAGTFIHAALKSRDANLIGESRPLLRPFLGFTESAVILGSVSVLFLAFVIVQFQYFFGGQTNIGVEGYTYSQYARRGFNELITVAFFSLVLILGLSALVRRETDLQKRLYSWLSVAVVGLVLVILTSAYQRISLAIDWHGFSRLRLYPRIFLIWLALLFVTVVILEILRRERYFALAAVVASVGFAVSLTLVNVDAATVKHNVPRSLQGKNLNVAHLASLSSDAVPALAAQFYSEAYPQWVHEGLGAALTCYLHFDSLSDDTDTDWRSFNFSRSKAHTTLQWAEQYLQDYGINDDQWWNVKVRTPSNVWYECKYSSAAEED
ncbi:MAG TPA: DUF4173 domain-containing protein [Anaerolineales bacterium]|nr:DUF4173 domain-containing protein [Anaerolineales bacterium]